MSVQGFCFFDGHGIEPRLPQAPPAYGLRPDDEPFLFPLFTNAVQVEGLTRLFPGKRRGPRGEALDRYLSLIPKIGRPDMDSFETQDVAHPSEKEAQDSQKAGYPGEGKKTLPPVVICCSPGALHPSPPQLAPTRTPTSPTGYSHPFSGSWELPYPVCDSARKHISPELSASFSSCSLTVPGLRFQARKVSPKSRARAR